MKLIKDSRAALSSGLDRSNQGNEADWAVQILGLFLVTDLGFIVLHVIYVHTGFLSDYDFSLEQDRGFSEVFQYVKEYWVAVVMGILAWRKHSLLYSVWSLLFTYLLLDDALQIHEKLGDVLSVHFAFPAMFGLQADDLGELVVSGSVGLFFLVGLTVAYRFADRLSQQTSRSLTLLFLTLVFFGIAIDMLHALIKLPPLRDFLALMEDGGELIVMSFIVCYVLSLLKRG